MSKRLSHLRSRFHTWLEVSGEPGAKGRALQVWEMVRLSGSLLFSPGEYYVYGFHKAGVRMPDIMEYMSSSIHFSRHLPAVNGVGSIPFLENKWIFHLHAASQRLPVPACYGVYNETYGFSTDGYDLRSAGDLQALVERNNLKTFIAKPIAGTQGDGVFAFDTITTTGGVALELEGKAIDFMRAADFLKNSVKGGRFSGVLIQERLRQDDRISRLSPTACPNLRLVTLRKSDGTVLVTWASIRIGRSGAIKSNAGSGGIIARVDANTGVIGPCRTSDFIDGYEIENHPDTGVRLTGAVIPDWDQVRELCQRAARTLPDAACIGWDVIFSDDGLKLLEGNHDWDLLGEQLFGQGYLCADVRKVLEGFGLSFPTDRLPPFKFRNVMAFLVD